MKFSRQLDEAMQAQRIRVELCLAQLLSAAELPSPLNEAARYVVLERGKRLRPILALLIESEQGRANEGTLTSAAALELLHAASLIHDDLPGMDDDDFRRGRPSCHKKFGFPTALMLGDLLPTIAFEFVAGSAKPALNQIITRAYRELCVGQQLDMMTPATVDEILRTHRFKTGALFGAAFVIGVDSAPCSSELSAKAWGAGQQLGVLYQLVDDFVDQFGDVQSRGRPSSSDKRNDKRTVFTMLGGSAGKNFVSDQHRIFCGELRTLEDAIGRRLPSVSAVAEAVLEQVGS